jgi:hypothetical protein
MHTRVTYSLFPFAVVSASVRENARALAVAFAALHFTYVRGTARGLYCPVTRQVTREERWGKRAQNGGGEEG